MTNVPPPPPPPSPAPAGGGDLVYPTTPPKDPILILVLNLLLLGGVGYIIMGQKTKGIVVMVGYVVIAVVTCGIGTVLSVLFAIDGYLQAQQLQQGHPIGQWTWFSAHM
ncbi:MAG TPA: hypothetical protein VNA69_02500 [Thermoanaerobaculia bacterium]|nr:hypothetical protein [Thermoanaerobaculia bacterium]